MAFSFRKCFWMIFVLSYYCGVNLYMYPTIVPRFPTTPPPSTTALAHYPLLYPHSLPPTITPGFLMLLALFIVAVSVYCQFIIQQISAHIRTHSSGRGVVYSVTLALNAIISLLFLQFVSHYIPSIDIPIVPTPSPGSILWGTSVATVSLGLSVIFCPEDVRPWQFYRCFVGMICRAHQLGSDVSTWDWWIVGMGGIIVFVSWVSREDLHDDPPFADLPAVQPLSSAQQLPATQMSDVDLRVGGVDPDMDIDGGDDAEGILEDHIATITRRIAQFHM